jgi:predicted TIM-barrel fold metal-dependent hydrolase
MSLPFTNVHTHVFNSECAPDRFLRILPVGFVRKYPGLIKGALDSKGGRKLIHGLFKVLSGRESNKRKELDKYIAFLDAGTDVSQMRVFETALATGKLYDSSVRIVGLTMNMDYMDSQPSKKQISFLTQLELVKDIKRYYPTNFFPFLGIDARHKSGQDLVDWAKPYFESGVVHHATKKVYPYFAGLKLYPALGFFPFDTKLEALYKYAEAHDIPVMTHCTRVGSQYIGAKIESLISKDPDMIIAPGNANALAAQKSIYDRIGRFYQKGWVKNSDLGENDYACDLFGHPENYVPLLEAFPKLKICVAHMGGSNEIVSKIPNKDLEEIRRVDGVSWFDKTVEMMKKYPNLYTDVSYTLADFANDKVDVLKQVTTKLLEEKDNFGNPLANRVLFGTDFFMTEQEKRESELYSSTKEKLKKYFEQITRVNPQEFLRQPL